MPPSPPQTRLAAIARALIAWFRTHARPLPWRRTRDPYGIWVSEIMLQQTQVKTVIPYWERWMRALPTIEALARAKPETVLKLWEGLGYYRRARHLHCAARRLLAERHGRFPATFADVLALPGIGRYTAGAICSIAYNQPTPVLDGNLIRVLTRLFAIRGDAGATATQARLWHLAELLVRQADRLRTNPRNPAPGEAENGKRLLHALPRPATGRPAARLRLRQGDTCSHLNQALMEFGAVLCSPRRPRCPQCPLRRLCRAFREGCVAALPNLRRRPATLPRHVVAFVIEQHGRFLVRQRPPGAVNAGLWEFPNAEVDADSWRIRADVATVSAASPAHKPRSRTPAVGRDSVEPTLLSLGIVHPRPSRRRAAATAHFRGERQGSTESRPTGFRGAIGAAEQTESRLPMNCQETTRGPAQRAGLTPRRFMAPIDVRSSDAFPSHEHNGAGGLPPGRDVLERWRAVAERVWGLRLDRLEPLGTVRHSITRWRIVLNVVRAAAKGLPAARGAGWRWVSARQLQTLPLAAAHRKICARLGPGRRTRPRAAAIRTNLQRGKPVARAPGQCLDHAPIPAPRH